MGGSSRETLEFAPEAYNYCTQDDSDPRNLVLLCTTQGTAVQQDGKGAKKLFHHAVDEAGKVHRYWLEAESSEGDGRGEGGRFGQGEGHVERDWGQGDGYEVQ